MPKYNIEEIKKEAHYLLANGCSYKEAATHLNISNSAFGRHMLDILKKHDIELFKKVQIQVAINIAFNPRNAEMSKQYIKRKRLIHRLRYYGF